MESSAHPTPGTRSLGAVIRELNNYPHEELLKQWKLLVDGPGYIELVGYIPEEFATSANWNKTYFDKCEENKTALLKTPSTGTIATGNMVLEQFCSENQTQEGFREGLQPWFDSMRQGSKGVYHPILTELPELQGLQVPSPVRGILGILTAGVHMNVYTTTTTETGEKVVDSMWVSRRSEKAATYQSCYDQIVAGALDPEDQLYPLAALKREAEEEAGLLLKSDGMFASPRDNVQLGPVEDAGRIYFCIKKDKTAGVREVGHIEPGVRFCFDLEVPRGWEPVPSENTIEVFKRLSVSEVVQSLADTQTRWKPNSALVTADFLRRKGLVRDQEFLDAVETLQKEPPLPIPAFIESEFSLNGHL